MEYEFIIDDFTLKRGSPVLLSICCKRCDSHLFFYQKDGPGPLLSCYFDRILAPEKMKNLHLDSNNNIPTTLLCHNCSSKIAEKDIYQKENRKIYLLVQESFSIEEIENKHVT